MVIVCVSPREDMMMGNNELPFSARNHTNQFRSKVFVVMDDVDILVGFELAGHRHLDEAVETNHPWKTRRWKERRMPWMELISLHRWMRCCLQWRFMSLFTVLILKVRIVHTD